MLPPTGAITTDQIMNELGVPIQQRDWPSLWGLASSGSIPKNKANAGGPYVLPDDWHNYTNTLYGGIITLNIPGVGDNIPPGPNTLAGYQINSSIRFNNTSSTNTLLFRTSDVVAPPAIIATSGAVCMQVHTSNPAMYFNTAPQNGESVPPNSFASWLSLGKTSGSGLIYLKISHQNSAGGIQTDSWTLVIS